MAKQFLDASGLNQYTQALKNGTLIVGKAQDASTAFYASHASATGLIGIIPIGNLPQGALEKLVKVKDQAERFALTTATVQNGDSVLQLDTNVMYIVVDDSKLSSEDGYVEYAAGTAAKALNADFATEAGHADTADDASNAKEAIHATYADDASTAKEADHADAADEATHARYADDASTAKEADHADAADEATHATYADDASTAKEADHADAADEATHATYADDASTAKQAPWSGITGKPDVFMPDVDSSSLATYSKDASTGDINVNDSLVTALAKLENKAEAGADERIPNDVIDSIVNGSYKPTA